MSQEKQRSTLPWNNVVRAFIQKGKLSLGGGFQAGAVWFMSQVMAT